MGSTHFQKLDEESRALHERWDDIARIVAITGLLAVVVWAACSALRLGVHHLSEALFHGVEHGEGLVGPATLLLAMSAAAVVRAALQRTGRFDDAVGDGMDVVLDNYHITYRMAGDDPQPRYERPTFSLALKKGLTTLLTLGSGGSGGLEAPVVLMSESLAAGISRVLRVRSEFELRTYQIAGISAAVATLLGAPFTAALFAAEIAYGDRIIYRKLAYALFAGVVAYGLNNRLHGYEPLFHGPSHSPVYSFTEYVVATVVALAVSMPVALAFGMGQRWARRALQDVPQIAVALVSMLAAGLVALGLWAAFEISPVHVLGMGEETIALILVQDAAVAAWWVLALIFVGKILTTGLTMAGGGSAGLLVPSMYLGGVSGALTAVLANETGWVELDPALFAVVGIGSALVAVIGVPLAAIALVLEVFGKSFGPPAILACGVTYLVTLKWKIYGNQRSAARSLEEDEGERQSSLGHRARDVEEAPTEELAASAPPPDPSEVP